MITVADLKQHLEQFDDDAGIVFRADTERELYDDVDYWEPDDGDTDRIRMKAISWKVI